jgi:hypothetical protein
VRMGCPTVTPSDKSLLYKSLNTVCEPSIPIFDDALDGDFDIITAVSQTSLYEIWTNGVDGFTPPPSPAPGTIV